MLIDKGSRTIFLDSSDIEMERVCPVCRERFRPNGTGPAGSPRATRLLHYLPSEHYLGGMAPTVHDWAYLVCPAGWSVHATYAGKSYTAMDKETADQVYCSLMHEQVRQRAPRATRWWFHLMVERNHGAVAALGAGSYHHEH